MSQGAGSSWCTGLRPEGAGCRASTQPQWRGWWEATAEKGASALWGLVPAPGPCHPTGVSAGGAQSSCILASCLQTKYLKSSARHLKKGTKGYREESVSGTGT